VKEVSGGIFDSAASQFSMTVYESTGAVNTQEKIYVYIYIYEMMTQFSLPISASLIGSDTVFAADFMIGSDAVFAADFCIGSDAVSV